MECMVEGEDIDPAELEQPGWLDIRRRMQNKASGGPAVLTDKGLLATTAGTRDKSERRRRKQKTSKPPIIPLPETDIKIVLRPRGGLALTSVPVAMLADLVMKAACLMPSDTDQVRIQPKANFIIISTPDEERAKKYTRVTALELNGKQYPVAAHVSAPANTVLGVIFNIPSTDTAEQIHHSLMHYNPDIGILEARRLNTSNIVQILFEGSKVPFWVRYRAATYRCKPFKRKTEACTTCWRIGHRQDVCPDNQPQPRCSLCGLTNPMDNHQCVPKCIVCEGAHQTGSPDCPRRFQPRRQSPTYAQVAANTLSSTVGTPQGLKQVPKTPSTGSSTKQAQKSKIDQASRSHNSTAKVSAQRLTLAGSLQSPLPPPSIPETFLNELRTIRRELTQLRMENEKLKEENQALKRAAILPAEQVNQPPLASHSQSSSTPPPPKRRATQASEPCGESMPISDDRFATVEQTCQRALAEQKAEYTHFHQTLLANQTTMQAMVEALKAEIAKLTAAMGAIMAPQAISQPLPDLPDDASQDL